MKKLVSAVALSLLSHPVISATQEVANEAPPIEPLGTGYLILLAVATGVILLVCWKYYMRWDEDDDKSDGK